MDEFDGYFLWLCDIINADLETYSELLFELYDSDFVWCMELDESRASEGLDLRKEYCDKNIGFDTDWVMLMEKPCSVLEALIALSRRMDYMLIEDNTSERIAVWFWEMIENLGLKKYTNTVIWLGGDDDRYDIWTILNRWMNREFSEDGSGSPFPLREAYADQREKTMVYQMNAYVLENYIFEE